MTATEILELVRAGFTKQEISTMYGVQTPAVQTPAVQTPAVQTPAVQTPAAQTPAAPTPAAPTPAAPTPAAQILPAMSYAQPQIYTPVLPDQRDATIGALKNENDALNKALEVLQRGMINNPVNGGQVTVDNVLESMINPPITK